MKEVQSEMAGFFVHYSHVKPKQRSLLLRAVVKRRVEKPQRNKKIRRNPVFSLCNIKNIVILLCMNIGIFEQNQRKQARYLSKRSQIIAKRVNEIIGMQVDCFSSYEYDKTKPSLDSLISACQTYNSGDPKRTDLLNQSFRFHGGLAAQIAKSLKSYGIYLEYGDIYGYFWEALNRLPDEWDKSKSTSQTALRSITIKLATQWENEHTYRGGVRVPRREPAKGADGKCLKTKGGAIRYQATSYKGLSINYDQDVLGLKDIRPEADSYLILSLAQ